MHFPENGSLYDIGDVLSIENDLLVPHELLSHITDIDLNKSSSVENISTRFCVDVIKSIPDILCCIYRTSMPTGIFPSVWSNGTVTLLPKPGDSSDPGNWRPITQTSVFAKLFERIHNRLYTHFEYSNLFSKYQYIFLPKKLTQLTAFDIVKHIYSSLNNRKVFGAACLDISKV